MRPRPALALFLAFLLLGACGPDEAPPSRVPTDPETLLDPAALLQGLGARIRSGRAISDATWGEDVAAVGEVLWPYDRAAPDAEALEGQRTHALLAHVTGDVAGRLARSAATREELAADDAISLQIHDELLEALGSAPDAYRRWIGTRGRRLLADLQAERMRNLAGEHAPR
jgi:hypothetical protein